MARTQRGCTASICLAHLMFLWLCASAQKSPPLHADVPVFAHVVCICKYLAAASHPLLTPSWVYINVMDSPETRRHLHICKMSCWIGAFWNKTNHPLHILTQLVLQESAAGAGDAAADGDLHCMRSFMWLWAAGSCGGSDGADGNSVLSSPTFSS